MASIKRFFAKKKLDVKFKKAGSGKTLSNADETHSQHADCWSDVPAERVAPTSDSKRAGMAALERVNKPKRVVKANLDMRSKVRNELDAESDALEKLRIDGGPTLVENDAVPMAHVLFKCPDVGPAVLPKDEMDEYIKEFLLSQLEEEPEMSSAVMIHTLNKDKEKVKICVETIGKYLENIIANPGEMKFCKIKVSNRILQERVLALNGAEEFLKSVGFCREYVRVDDEDVEFYRLSEEHALSTDRLVNVREILLAAEPIHAQLDRSLAVFRPSAKGEQFHIPDEFYNVSRAEIKREKEIRQEAIEKMGMLRTKAMRERDEIKEMRRYRYSLVRVRFPDGLLLQGTFKANERLPALFEFVRENIVNDWVPFSLILMTGSPLPADGNQTLVELGLAPSVIVNFSWDEKVMGDIMAAQGEAMASAYLRPELLEGIQSL